MENNTVSKKRPSFLRRLSLSPEINATGEGIFSHLKLKLLSSPEKTKEESTSTISNLSNGNVISPVPNPDWKNVKVQSNVHNRTARFDFGAFVDALTIREKIFHKFKILNTEHQFYEISVMHIAANPLEKEMGGLEVNRETDRKVLEFVVDDETLVSICSKTDNPYRQSLVLDFVKNEKKLADNGMGLPGVAASKKKNILKPSILKYERKQSMVDELPATASTDIASTFTSIFGNLMFQKKVSIVDSPIKDTDWQAQEMAENNVNMRHFNL